MLRASEPFSRRRPLRWHSKLARKLLEYFFHLCFLFRTTLRFDLRFTPTKPCVIAVFHDEMVATVEYFKHAGFTSIASRNHNGYAVAQVIQKAGISMVYGSSSKGGKEAFYQLGEALKNGSSVIFTVDGSRGPRHEMKAGAITLAKKMGVPLYLVRFHAHGFRLPTWDRFMMPFPFSTVRVNYDYLDFGNNSDNRSIKDLLRYSNNRLQTL